MKGSYWKYLSIPLLIYAIVGGLLMTVPRLAIVNETIRGLYYHVPMWFGMVALFLTSTYYAIRHLMTN
ncbi:MAG TPA: ABC transporter permease, partial [Cyclobacteriaceae bacterium]|nr:ABC transporter permease [Cyclobacteriaceae bacterium]